MSEQDLNKIRIKIDDLDQQIQQLISERAKCAQQVAEVKMRAGEAALFYRPEREAQVLRAVKERNSGPLDENEMARLFREIMAACLALEQPLNVAYLGPGGSYTHMGALKHFGASIKGLPAAQIDDVFREVEAGNADFGIVPIENSTEGVISHTLDMLLQSSLVICGEVDLPIHHNLISHCTELSAVTKVYSHQQSLAQCRNWLTKHLPAVETIAVSSNSHAVTLLKDDSSAAAIAGQVAADLYAVPVLNQHIEDRVDNTTRFVVLGKHSVPASGDDKTSLLVLLHNKAGALHDLLSSFAERGISMSKIESRPAHSSGVWEYVFFIDIQGHRDDANVAAAISDLEHKSAMLKVLGSYPVAVL
ncbi:MAG: prephenate dehydratase [Gammaproteobacteria bacterium]|nr:prephenate dehydratase [Gammaproteobacteria bacterium]